MKKILFAFAIVAASFAANAQEIAPKQVIKINPLGALFGAANLTYEKAINDKSSFGISPSFGFFSTGGYKYTTFGIGGEYRVYLSKTKTAPTGLYVGPGVGYSFGKAKWDEDIFGNEEGDKITVSGISARGVIGHQWIWNSGFTLDLNGGVQYFNLKASGNDEPLFSGFSGVLPTIGVAIGYGF